MASRVRAYAGLATTIAAALSLTCGEGAGPDPNATARVVVSPATGSVDTGDSLQLSAVAQNAQGASLSAKTFTWSTLDPTLVTVSGSGQVHGRWPGSARIVAASEGVSDTATLQVIPRISRLVITVPRDTLRSLFEAMTVSVRAFIDSQPYPGGSYTWSLSSLTVAQIFPAGADSLRTLQALANGSVFVRAVEARGASDSARIVVRQRPKNIFFPAQLRAYRACPWRLYVSVTDSLNFPVTDGVVFSSSDSGLARIDSTGLMTPLAVGIDTISAQAGSLKRSAALTITAAPTVTLRTSGVVAAVSTVGVGQYAVGQASLSGGGSNDAPARFSIVSSDTAILAVPYDSTVPMGWLDLALLHLVGRRTGAVTLTPYLCDVPGSPVSFTVTRSRLGLAGDLVTTARIDDPPALLNLQTRDTTGAWQYAAAPVTVEVVGTDPTVLRPDSGYHHIPAGSASSYVFFAYPDSGSTRLVVRDSGGLYLPDSTALIHVAYPPVLFADADTLRLAMRQRLYRVDQPFQHHNVLLDRYVVGDPISIHLLTSDTTVARVSPDSVVIPAGPRSGAPFDIAGGDVQGTATLTARAHRHLDGHLVVKTDRPTVGFYNFGSGQYPGDSMRVELVAYDSATFVRGYPTEDVTFTLSVNDTSVVSIAATTLTIPAGAETSAAVFAVFKKPGTATVTVTDPRAVPYAYAPATTPPVDVLQPYLSMDSVISLGIQQNWNSYVVAYGPPQGAVTVHMQQRNAAVLSLSDTVFTIAAGEMASPWVGTGIASGADTLVITAAGFKPDTAIVTVEPGKFYLGNWPSSLGVGDSIPEWIYLLTPNGMTAQTADTVVFTLSSNANLEFRQGGVAISTVTIPAGQTYTAVEFYIKGKAAGTGSVTISSPNYVPVTQPITVSP